VGETAGLVGRARKAFDKTWEMLNHSIVIGRIIARNAEHLTDEVSLNFRIYSAIISKLTLSWIPNSSSIPANASARLTPE
jgi:hypothetical protein